MSNNDIICITILICVASNKKVDFLTFCISLLSIMEVRSHNLTEIYQEIYIQLFSRSIRSIKKSDSLVLQLAQDS